MIPNRLFEFIQTPLTLSLGLTVETKKIVRHYNRRLLANDIEPQTTVTRVHEIVVELAG